jgi:hypothetical protein
MLTFAKLATALLLTVVEVLLLPVVQADSLGYIALTPYVSNQNEATYYEFQFSTSTPITTGAVLQITFPSEFAYSYFAVDGNPLDCWAAQLQATYA